MNRRKFLHLMAGGLALPIAGDEIARSRNLPVDVAASGNYCRTRLPVISSAAARTSGDLAFEGTHILALGALREISAQYNLTNQPRLMVRGGGCDDGIAAVTRGTADLGGMCCPVRKSSAENLPSLVVAQDIKAVVVHPGNPLNNISLRALSGVARGDSTRWSDLGGPDRAIAFVIRNHCPDYVEPVRQILLDNQPNWARHSLFVDTDEKIVETVARFPGALGVVSWVFAKPLVEQGQLKLLAVDGMPLQSARSGGYRLTGPLAVVFSRWDDARMGPFFDYLYSAAGHTIISGSLIPVSREEAGYSRSRFRLSV